MIRKNLARFCFAKEDVVLEEACRKIGNIPISAV
jgi:hypothetical protein